MPAGGRQLRLAMAKTARRGGVRLAGSEEGGWVYTEHDSGVRNENSDDQIPAELPERIRREASARGIAIASVTGTFNMSHPDVEHRRTGLRRLRVLAEACPQMGTSSIHVCTGTRDPNNMWRHHPDNDSPESWRDMAACMR